MNYYTILLRENDYTVILDSFTYSIYRYKLQRQSKHQLFHNCTRLSPRRPEYAEEHYELRDLSYNATNTF